MSELQDCQVESLNMPLGLAVPPTTVVAYLVVRGMGRPCCAMRVCNGLLGLDGVLTADIQKGITVALYDPERITTNNLETAVAAAGNYCPYNYRTAVLDQIPVAQVFRLMSERTGIDWSIPKGNASQKVFQ